jgi:hypothetical protein
MSKHAANTTVTHGVSDQASVGHEYRDVSTAWTIFSAAVVAALIVGCCVTARWLFDQLLEPAELRGVTSATGEGLVLPPSPRLEGIEMMTATAQQTEEPRLANARAEAEQLQSYGWVNSGQRTVHIPIRRAMEIVAEKGLSAIRPASSASPSSVNNSNGQPNRSANKTD